MLIFQEEAQMAAQCGFFSLLPVRGCPFSSDIGLLALVMLLLLFVYTSISPHKQ